MALTPLFDSAVPPGFRYEREFISQDEEAGLVDAIGRVDFSTFVMRGAVARRRVAFFGRSYDAAGGGGAKIAAAIARAIGANSAHERPAQVWGGG